MSFVLGVFASPPAGSSTPSRPSPPPRAALLRALDLVDDGSWTFEIGRPETGATCALVEESEGGQAVWRVHLPLLRSPTSAHDLLPALVGALGSCGAWLAEVDEVGAVDEGDGRSPPSADELIAAWQRAHDDACRELQRACLEQGLPPPPHLPRAELERLHGWLVAIAPLPDVARPILGLDPADGRPTRLAVGLPDDDRGLLRVPPVHAVLRNIAGETRVFPLTALPAPGPDGFVHVDLARLTLDDGEPLGRTRVVSPVEIVDEEALAS